MNTQAQTYAPTTEDKQWALMMVSSIADGGFLVYPATGATYRVDHKAKTLTLTTSDPDYGASYEVFKAIGYTVMPKRGPKTVRSVEVNHGSGCDCNKERKAVEAMMQNSTSYQLIQQLAAMPLSGEVGPMGTVLGTQETSDEDAADYLNSLFRSCRVIAAREAKIITNTIIAAHGEEDQRRDN